MGGGRGPFGMYRDGLAECAALLPGTGLRLCGLHAHLASGLGVRAALRAAAGVLRFARRWCDRQAVTEPVIVTRAPVTLSGQLCTPKDVLARDVRVRRLRAGDLVAFAMAGAYAWNISHSRFLMHTEPGCYYIGEDVT
jgi:diaminopimelate decarboxylase